MKILCTGGSSLLGKYLLQTSPKDYEVESTFYTNPIPGLSLYHLDVCNQSQVDYVFSRVKPDIVIHCAAIGSVDFAESHFTETHMVNVIGTRNIIKATRDCDANLVYISSNAVFSGNNPPYSETSECHPINRYGSIKKEAEQSIIASRNWIIIRPFLLYGWPYPGGRQNWMTTILNKLDKRESCNLVNDVYWQHTSAEDLALAIWKIIEVSNVEEIYHVASDEKMTLYDFGLKVAQIFRGNTEGINPISSDQIKGLAPRPKDTTFNLTKLHNLGIKLRNVEEGLKGLVK
jgi:dTDP-4-dehydrorhamnose reductase